MLQSKINKEGNSFILEFLTLNKNLWKPYQTLKMS